MYVYRHVYVPTWCVSGLVGSGLIRSGLWRGHTQLTNCQGKIKYFFLQLLNCNNAERAQFRKEFVGANFGNTDLSQT